MVVGTDHGLESVRSGAISAFIAEAPTLRYYAGKQPCDVAVVGKSFGPLVYVLGLQVGYRCQAFFNINERKRLSLRQATPTRSIH
jgi:hypothetical protein